MQVRWSPDAVNDLFDIAEYISHDSAVTAQKVVTEIYDRVRSLETFPDRGRQGRVSGTRELPLPALPYILVYRALEDAVEIVNIIHGAQQWPKSK
jgi:toxin ParE1/3/4